MNLMIFVLYFLAALLAMEGITTFFRRQSDPARVKARLQHLGTRMSKRASEGAGGQDSILVGRHNIQWPSIDRLRVMLYRAGTPTSPARFLVLSATLGLIALLSIFAFTNDAARATLGLTVAALPFLWLRSVAAKRARLFEEQLPESLELMTRTIRTGHSLVSGFQIVGEEMPDPIGTEFGLVAEELRLGLELREALDNLIRRTENPDVPYFATALMIQRQTGGNLAELLDNLSSLLRERIQFAGRVRAMTAQGRGAATFLALWLPAMVVLMWIVAPGYLAPLIENQWGHIALACAFGLDITAYIMARRIADVQA